MSTPTLKRGESAERVRKALVEATRPLTITEITAATGTKSKQVTTLLSKWTAKQAVIRYGTQGRGRIAGYTYTIGPKTLRTMTYDRECNKDLRARETAPGCPSSTVRNFRYGATPTPTSPPQAKPVHETVEQFLARGGSVERLPGIKSSPVYLPRRPVLALRGAKSP